MTEVGIHVCVVGDDPAQLSALDDQLARRGCHAVVARMPAVAGLLATRELDAALAAVEMSWGDGYQLCRLVERYRPGLPVVLYGPASVHSAVAALRAGAADYLTTPLSMDEVIRALTRVVRRRGVERKVKRIALTPVPCFDEIIGDSPPMRRLFDLTSRVAASDVSVLITGETGVGKELVATAIHRRSRRSAGPFVEVDCAAMPEQLLESELFGHTRGAFTDAKTSHTGLLLHAQSGTLFLDEIGDMPAGLQPKLLRVLQQRVVRPVGSTTGFPVDLRVIAATHRDLELEVRRRSFRHDLFFRINVVQIDVPPLRERGDDILLLAHAFTTRYAVEAGKAVRGLSTTAAERLRSYPWPGNVRELKNCIERAVALTSFDQITLADLPQRIQEHRPISTSVGIGHEGELMSMEQVERRYITRVLRQVEGNKALAARILGLDRKTLYRKLDRYRIDIPTPVPQGVDDLRR